MKVSDIKKQFEHEGFECFYQGQSKKNLNIFLPAQDGRISIGEYRGEVKKFKICNISQLYIRETNAFLINDKSLYFNICFSNEVMFDEIEPALELAKKIALEYKKLQERIELIRIAMDSL